jgi:hypothetical protein
MKCGQRRRPNRVYDLEGSTVRGREIDHDQTGVGKRSHLFTQFGDRGELRGNNRIASHAKRVRQHGANERAGRYEERMNLHNSDGSPLSLPSNALNTKHAESRIGGRSSTDSPQPARPQLAMFACRAISNIDVVDLIKKRGGSGRRGSEPLTSAADSDSGESARAVSPLELRSASAMRAALGKAGLEGAALPPPREFRVSVVRDSAVTLAVMIIWIDLDETLICSSQHSRDGWVPFTPDRWAILRPGAYECLEALRQFGTTRLLTSARCSYAFAACDTFRLGFAGADIVGQEMWTSFLREQPSLGRPDDVLIDDDRSTALAEKCRFIGIAGERVVLVPAYSGEADNALASVAPRVALLRLPR